MLVEMFGVIMSVRRIRILLSKIYFNHKQQVRKYVSIFILSCELLLIYWGGGYICSQNTDCVLNSFTLTGIIISYHKYKEGISFVIWPRYPTT